MHEDVIEIQKNTVTILIILFCNRNHLLKMKGRKGPKKCGHFWNECKLYLMGRAAESRFEYKFYDIISSRKSRHQGVELRKVLSDKETVKFRIISTNTLLVDNFFLRS